MCICYLEGVWGCLVEPGTLCPLIAGVSSWCSVIAYSWNTENKLFAFCMIARSCISILHRTSETDWGGEIQSECNQGYKSD